jgi:hypothetical protein
MASGINTTFRQVGIATSIAALGSVFTSQLSGATATTITAHYATALNLLLLIVGLLALTAGASALALIRQEDFVAHGPTPEPAESARTADGTEGARTSPIAT